MLGLVVTAHLFRTFPDLREGDLARIKAAVVSSVALLFVAGRLDVNRLGGPSFLPKVSADALEGLSMKAKAWTYFVSVGVVAWMRLTRVWASP